MAKNPWEEDYGVAKAPWEEDYGEYKPEPQKEATIGSQFIGGAKQVGADVSTFLKSLTSPNIAAEEAVKKQEEIQKEVGNVRGLSDVTNAYKQKGILSAAGEMASQAPGAIAASTPQMVTAIAGNVAGAAAGSVVPGIGTVVGGYLGGALALFPQFYAENLAEQAQSQQEKGQKVDVNRAKAALAAAGQAGLEEAGMAYAYGKNFLKGLLTKIPTTEAEKAIAEKALIKSAESTLKTVATGAGKTALEESFVNPAQDILQRAQAGEDLFSEEAIKGYGEAIYGSILQAPLGGLAGLHEARQAQKQVNINKDTEKNLEEQLKKEKENADAAAMSHFGLNTEELNEVLSESKQEPTNVPPRAFDTQDETIPDFVTDSENVLKKLQDAFDERQSKIESGTNPDPKYKENAIKANERLQSAINAIKTGTSVDDALSTLNKRDLKKLNLKTTPPAKTETTVTTPTPENISAASAYIDNIDKNIIKPSFPALQKHIKALGLEMPESGPNRTQRAIELLRNHLAPQGEQNVGDNAVVGTDTTSAEISQQQGLDTTAEGTPGTIPGSMAGTDTTQGQPGTREETQRDTLEQQAADEAKQKAALEQQAIENETVEKKSIEELEAGRKKQAGRTVTDTGQGLIAKDSRVNSIKYDGPRTEEPSAQNYLNQNSYYGKESPKTVEQGIENAGHDEAFDNFDAVSYEKDILPTLQEKANAINKERKAQRQSILNKEGRYSASTDAEAKTAANQIKDVSPDKPLEFMSLDELEELYRSKVLSGALINEDIEGGEDREEAAANRQAFIDSLDPLQKKKVELAEKEAFRKEVEGTTSLGPTKSSDKRKSREAILESRKLKAKQEIKEQLAEDEAEAKAETAAINTMERARPDIKGEPIVEVSARVKNNIEKAINEKETADKNGVIKNRADKVISAIADDKEVTFGKRIATTFKELVKTFGGLKIEFGNIKDDGQFNPENNTVTLKGENGKYTGTRNIVETVLHEVGHYLTDHVFDNPEAYIKSLPKEEQPIVRAAINRLRNNFNYAKGKLGDKFNIPTIKEFIAETYSNPKFQEALAGLETGETTLGYAPRQFIETKPEVKNEKGEVIKESEGYVIGNDREIQGPLPKQKQYVMPKESLYQKIVRNIASVFGFEIKGEGDLKNKPTAAVTLKETLEDIARIISLPTADIRGKEISFSRTTPPKQAPFLEITNAYEENEAFTIPENLQESRINNTIKQYFSYQGLQNAIKFIQNKQQFTKNIEREITLADKLNNIDLEKKNDLYTQQSTWVSDARNKFHEKVQEPLERLQQTLVEFAKTDEIIEATEKANTARKKKNPNARELSPVDFMQGVLHIYGQAFTDAERRLNMFFQTAPLDNKNKVVPWDNKKITVADFRELLLGNQTLNKPGLFDKSLKLTDQQARALWLQLENYVFTKDANGEKIPNTQYVVPGGFSPDGRTATDFRSDDGNAQYNVTGFKYQETEKILNQYNNDKNKDLLDKIFNATYELNNITKEFNKSSNYMSKPAANWVAAYGYEKYLPLKGITAHTPTSRRVGLEFNGKLLETELVQAAIKSEGRFSVSSNPILQSINDVFVATTRAGKGPGFTLAIKNLIEKSPTKIDNKKVDLNPNGQGWIKGKVIEHIPFYDRSADKIKSVRKDNTIFHHNEDGSIDVIEINDRNALESIRVPFKKSNPFVEMANSITSTLGQYHTRYNVNFAPQNFVRDTLTNSWTIGAEFGPEVGAKLIQQISAQLTTKNALGKAWKFARAYKTPDLHKLKDSKDPVEKNMYEYIINRGMVEYMDGISLRSNLTALNKEAGRNKILKTKDQVDKLVDAWTNMFELASRSAAYGVIKQHYINSKKLTEKEASIRAAAYVKNLANFEQTGTIGKELGSLYMFFRPSATGAVRALEAVAPAMPGSLERALEHAHENIKNDPEALKNFINNYKEQQKSARIMTTALMGLGVLAYTMSYMMADTDDMDRNKVLTDDMTQWNRNWRIFIPGFDKPFQVSWGFGLGAFTAMGAQLAAAVSGQQSLGAAMKNGATQIALDSFVPIPVSRMDITDNPAMWAVDSISPSLIRPIIEFVANKNGLGQDIYNDATGRKLGDAYLGGERIPEFYKIVARNLAEASYGYFDWTPNSLYFLTNSYADGPSRLIDYALNSYYLATGNKEFDAKTDIPFLGSFVGAVPNIDNREFSSIEKQIQDMTGKVNEFKKFNPEYYYSEYLAKYPMNEAIIKVYDQSLPPLNKLRAEKKLIEGANYDLATRKQLLEMNKQQQNMIKYNLVQIFKTYGIEP